MVAPGNTNPTGIQAPPPPGQGRTPIRAAGVENATPSVGQQVSGVGYQGKPTPTVGEHVSPNQVLHQRSKLPFCPARVAVGGFAMAVVIGYFALYTHKKPEATALDVAKVATGIATPENTHPRRK